jgi:hypothetical protein
VRVVPVEVVVLAGVLFRKNTTKNNAFEFFGIETGLKMTHEKKVKWAEVASF